MLNRHWTIGEKVHGGAMLALCAKRHAALSSDAGEDDSAGDERSARRLADQPIAVSGSFLWAPDPGPLRVVPRCASAGGGSAWSTSN